MTRRMSSVTIAEAIRGMIRESGVGVRAVADRIGVKRQNVYHWMSGKGGVTVASVMKLCKVCGMQLAVIDQSGSVYAIIVEEDEDAIPADEFEEKSADQPESLAAFIMNRRRELAGQ